MTLPSKQGAPQDIGVESDLLEMLGADALTTLIGLGADIVCLVDEDGIVNQFHYRNRDLDAYGLAKIVGKPLRDCVTVESAPKIDALLGPATKKRPARGYQVNHSATGQPDLPVAYSAGTAAGFPYTIVVGHEMRQQMQDQQRLVEAQIAMEADYRELRQAEARYRTVFKMSETPHLVLDGEKRTILEANAAAVSVLTGGTGNLTGKPVRDLFKKEDRERLSDAIGEARHSGEPIQLDALHGAKGARVDARLRAYREHGATNLIVTLRDCKEAGDEVVHHTTRNANGADIDLDLLPEAALKTDSDGMVLAANTLFLDRVHAPTHNQVLGRNVSNWLGKSAVELNVLFTRIKDERTLSGFSSVLTDTLGEDQDVVLSARYDRNSETIQLLVIPQPASVGKVALQPPATQDQTEGFASLVGKVPLKELIRESLDVVEKICIEAALEKTQNNRASAAEMLGLSRQSLYIKLRRHGLENYRPGS
ncbi:transcriptional regulator PpsR [Roseibium sp. FZY0029]|uniref:transcriptional regulator PpsR n=1 Tax=Roseibium sp. FZY0029 TaxID=3116647 RepID=UPI002EBA02A2|nr:transcriptional regulator PpsR [Roseibium sp. FZY0029]